MHIFHGCRLKFFFIFYFNNKHLDTFFDTVKDRLLDDIFYLHYILSNDLYKFIGSCYSVSKYDYPTINAINLD